MPKPYFAFVGKMRSGKTTTARFLVDNHGFERFSFAMPVKMDAIALANTFLIMHGREPNVTFESIEENKVFWRPFLQYVGTQLGRQLLYEEVWIDAFVESFRVAEKSGGPMLVTIDDCRFVNEAEALRGLGFTIIKLVRDETERVYDIRKSLSKQYEDDVEMEQAFEAIMTHPSEAEVDKIVADIDIENNSLETLESLANILATENNPLRYLRQYAADTDKDGAYELEEIGRWEGEGGQDD